MMIAYVSFVAITNLLLGMALARYLAPPAVQARHTGDRTSAPSTPPICIEVVEARDNESTSDSAVPPTEEVVPTEEPAAAAKEADKPTLAELWNEFAAQLRDVSERVNYCRAAQDIALAQQAASRLKSFVREWYVQFEECLNRELPAEASPSAPNGQTLGAVEMFAAQLETTLSNIDGLDYTQPVDDVLDVLKRELETLDRQRRSFAKDAEGSA